MALDSQQSFPNKIVLQHNAASSKFYQKIVFVLLIALQVICGFIIHNFYGDFVELEDEVVKLQMEVEELRIKLDFIAPGPQHSSGEFLS